MKLFEKPLTAAEERQYLLKLCEDDANAQDILIRKNMRLVAHMVKKYSSNDMETEANVTLNFILLVIEYLNPSIM